MGLGLGDFQDRPVGKVFPQPGVNGHGLGMVADVAQARRRRQGIDNLCARLGEATDAAPVA
jgi:hypothetical protein